jgi:transcriptional regulator with XRE-family HTH domain
MPESFGARLRQRREEQAIALIAIAEQTKIKLSLLEALERDDVSHWPSGIFRRAYIRAYAHAIGLNPDVVVREFLEIHPEPAEIVEPLSAIASAADGARTSAGPPTRLRYLLDSAIESFSRLRRGLALKERALADGAPDTPPAPVEPGLPAAEHPSPEPGRVRGTNRAAADRTPLNRAAPFEPDFLAVAHLCTEFGRVENIGDVQRLLQEAARILNAIGLIVWVWDARSAQLRPALVHGYSDKVLAQLPPVTRESDNATAAAFRSAQTCATNGSDHTSGALVVPMLTSAGCAGVLAIELQHGSEQARSVRAAATILAALLAQLIGGAPAAEVYAAG